jgi:predicted transcriptional regulator
MRRALKCVGRDCLYLELPRTFAADALMSAILADAAVNGHSRHWEYSSFDPRFSLAVRFKTIQKIVLQFTTQVVYTADYYDCHYLENAVPHRRKSPRLSAGEMEIMQLLWQLGSATLAEAQAGFDREIAYTTMQTRLNRLVDKGVVARSAERPARYSPAVAPADVSARHLDLLLERVSDGSVVPLVAHLVRDRSLTADEIAELKALIAQAEDAELKRTGKKSKPNQ